jgi:hypothetical protein
MLIDTAIMGDVFQTSIWNFFKLSLMNVLFFYWIPKRVFPQFMILDRLDRVMFNIIYMLGFILLSIPILVQLHLFSLPLFLLLLLLLKVFFLYHFEKRNFLNETIDSLRNLLIKILDFIDNFYENWQKQNKNMPSEYVDKIDRKLSPRFLQKALTWSVFGYILYLVSLGGFISYADAVPDTAQFVEWVNTMHSNKLFVTNKTAGADFFGQATIVFFFQIISNIDSIILFNIYPIFLVWFVLFGLYYVVYKITFSRYSAFFSVVLFGIVFLSPLGDLFLGYTYTTSVPPLTHLFGFDFYLLWEDQVSPEVFKDNLVSMKHIPYERYSAGLAYELASSMFLISNYFIAKSFFTKKKGYIILYGITLFLVFVFHGGGAIYLVVANVFILIAAILFGHLKWKIFKQGLFTIVIASILGNLWMLSVIKYGIPQDFGAAAPFLDNLFETKKSVENVADGGEIVSFIVINRVQMSLVFLMSILPIFIFFIKRKFVFMAMTLSIISVLLIFFAANLGLPRAAKQFRAAEYVYLVFAMGSGFYFYFFIARPLRYFHSHKARYLALAVSVIFLAITFVKVPRWIDTNRFMTQTNSLEYNNLAYILYQISQENQPYTWTSISYVQTYPKVLGKGYHINTPDFLFKYDPREKYLEIPEKKVFIFVENKPNSYMGTHQWYYRWRPQIEEQLKEWVGLYEMLHNNISIYYQNEIVTIYEIDNSEYVIYENKRLQKLKDRKRHAVD